MIYYILLFIIYFALTSVLHRWANQTNYREWVNDIEKSFPDLESCKRFVSERIERQIRQSTEILISYICHNCHKEHYFESNQLPGGAEHCPYCEVCGGRLLKNESSSNMKSAEFMKMLSDEEQDDFFGAILNASPDFS